MSSRNHDSATDESSSSLRRAGDYGSRLTALEVQVKNIKETIEKYMATKKDISDLQRDISDLRMATKKDISDLRMSTKQDISDLKVWILSGMIGVMFAAATLTTVIARAFF